MISGDQLHFMTQMGQDIPERGTPDYKPVCGQPHRARMDQDGSVIVLESYLGLYKVNPRTGQKTLLLSSEKGDATSVGKRIDLRFGPHAYI